NAAHFHVVGDDEAGEADALFQDRGDPVAGDGGGRLVLCLRINGVGNHDEGQPGSERAEGCEIFVPELFPGAMYVRGGAVRVERASAEAGKMFAAAEDAFGGQPVEECGCVENDVGRVRGDGAGFHHGCGDGQGEVEDGGEGGVEAEGFGFAGDEEIGRAH